MSAGAPFRTAGVVFAVVLLICAGAGAARLLTTQQPGGTMVVLVGGSPSAQSSPQAIAECAEAAGARAIATGAQLTIVPVGSVPADLRTSPISTALTFAERLDPAGAEHAREELSRQVAARVAVLADGPRPSGSSDTITAIEIAAEQLAQAAPPRQLEVCDDAHEVGRFPFGRVDFYSERLTPARVRELLAQMRPWLPDLSTVAVTFGATDTDRLVRVRWAREAAIGGFWSAWALVTHAQEFSYREVASGGED
ncbi:MAG TPA: hypothetical protein VKB25_05265 [Conexibacter sp.]|nr:hypothetical protein [Conexibacter sp.]